MSGAPAAGTGPVACTGVLRIRLADAERARTALAALAPDDDAHAATRLEGSVLVVEARSGGPMGLLRALDDVLGCLRALDEP